MDYLLDWRFQTFDELATSELYAILRLRSEVFVLEQRCCFLDMDNKDQLSYHLSGYHDGQLMAFARIVPPGLSYEYPAIGRIVVSPKGRGAGYGIELLNVSIQKLEELYGKVPIRIGAQVYLKKFYESFGFSQSGAIYLEDDIEHIEMTRPVQ